MARAACGLSAQDICALLGVSRVALNNAEAGRKPLGAPTWARLQAFYEGKGILFGPHHWVGTGSHVIQQEGAMVLALWHLLQDHGITPNSQELLAAYQRALQTRSHTHCDP
jgi:transcriptional regulator with XRE-family HTH domain